MHRLLQLTLDLFDAPVRAPPPGRVQAQAQEVALGPTPIQPAAMPAPARPAAPAPPAAVPAAAAAQPLDQVVGLASFIHPQATRQALLGHVQVAYAFKRGRRRNIGFTVGPEGLTVSAPKWVPLPEVDAAVRSKARWITAKLEQMRERGQRTQAAQVRWSDGASFPFLGEPVVVVLDPRHNFAEAGAVLNTDLQAPSGAPRLSLQVGLAHDAGETQIRDAVQAWLMRQASSLFTERLDHFAPKLGVRWTKLRLSSAGTRWGTAHSDGTIRLNWRLVHMRMPVIDYVVAHELSHLRVMDHSPRFWDTVATVVPDYPQLRRQLKDEALPSW